MKKTGWIALALLLGLVPTQAQAIGWRKVSPALEETNQRLTGRIVDYTANHGKDNRIWSKSLYQRRDAYVYLPPRFDPHQKYPLLMWFHGFAEDEQQFLRHVAPLIDSAIVSGQLPPVIVVAPDGSCGGEPCVATPGSFFINSQLGAYEDFVLLDLWDFMSTHYPIRPEREAHVLAGVSMGGFAAFNLGIRHRYAFGVVVGIFPPLNLRWVDDQNDYQANFDPNHWGWRISRPRRGEPMGRLAGGLVTLRINHLLDPLFCDKGNLALVEVSRDNPIELIDRLGLKNGELAMYAAYGGQDEFNIDAQVESFLYLCKHRGIEIGVGHDPQGRHNLVTAQNLWPGIVRWLGPRLAPYSPASADPAPVAQTGPGERSSEEGAGGIP